MEYHAGVEWDSLQAGRPLDMMGSHINELPMEYHARERSLEFYRTKGKSGTSHRGTTVKKQ